MIPAIIPARGGSKGIPRKNLVDVCGIPLLVWSIEHAKTASAVDEVIVTTDDSEIGRLAMDHGAKVFWRSAETATDTATSESALLEVVNGLGLSAAECIVFLQATSPIRQPGDIDAVVELVTSGMADSAFSARNVEGFLWKQNLNDCYPTYAIRTRRQDQAMATLEENGSIYAFRPAVLMQGGSRIGGTVLPHLMHPLDSFQIDEPADIPFIEQLMELRLGCERTAASR